MKMSVSEFKAKCTHVLHEVAAEYKTIKVTNCGKTIALAELTLLQVHLKRLFR